MAPEKTPDARAAALRATGAMLTTLGAAGLTVAAVLAGLSGAFWAGYLYTTGVLSGRGADFLVDKSKWELAWTVSWIAGSALIPGAVALSLLGLVVLLVGVGVLVRGLLM
jgi:hypothetical protein